MNHIYRLLWNRSAQLWVAVAESAKSCGKAASHRRSAMALALVSPLALAAPVGGVVTAGGGTITQNGNTTTITQNTGKLAIDWNSFSSAANEAIIFNQPGASSIALNRVLGASPSALLGSLTANGQVFILNPNGILFGNNAQVNVGGLVASTLSLSNADFMAGNNSFSGSGGSVVNQGTLTAAVGGYIALLGPQVRNEGVISATLGTALLGAGNKVTLNLDNGSLLGYSIDQGALDALAENKQLIRADGGQVLMSAQALNSLGTAVVNNSGVIEARTLQNRNGVIKLLGDMAVGQTNVGGTLDASAPAGGNGGFIETSAARVKVAGDTVITTRAVSGNTGTWLVDPTDFTVAASGGDITGTALGNSLANTNVTLESSTGTSSASGTSGGNININDVVRWSSNSSLTLNAANNINLNAAVTVTGSNAGLVLNYGNHAVSGNAAAGSNYFIKAPVTLSGSNASLAINGDAYTLLHSMSDVAGISFALGGRYAVAQDLDASAIAYGSAVVATGATGFSGIFTGLGHSISGLNIAAAGGDNIGLFGTLDGGTIRNLALTGGSVTGNNRVGGLVGWVLGNASIANVTSSINVTGINDVGGLVGNNSGIIANASTSGTVYGSAGGSNIGGLVGANLGSIANSSSSASVNTNGYGYAGGLVGSNTKNGNQTGSISNSFASGNVNSSGEIVGGLVGDNNGGTISVSYASGNVQGGRNVGGLAGRNINGSTVDNAYASGNVSGNFDDGSVNHANIGGLLGDLYAGTVSNVFSNGSVNGAGFYGVSGMIGTSESGTLTHAYYDAERAGVGSDPLATGLTTAQTTQQSSFTGFDFTSGASIWQFGSGGLQLTAVPVPVVPVVIPPVTVPDAPAAPAVTGPFAQLASALGGGALTTAYGGALNSMTGGSNPGSGADASGQSGRQSSAPLVTENAGSQQITPRLSSLSCGVRMPGGAPASACQ